jgi:hypothetical protein
VRFAPLRVVLSLFAVLPVGSIALAATYEVAPVPDGGTIKGKVMYRGSVPTKTVLPTKDKETCGGPRKDPLVIVGPGGEVQDVVVHLKEIAKGKDWPKVSGKPQIDNLKCVFHPHVQVVRVGPIDVHNSDPVLHNTHGYYGKDTAFNVALPVQGGRVSKILRRPGVVRVDCDAHGWMEGWVYVTPNPYYSLTGADGTFTISDVPPGNYTLTVWQEHVGIVEMPVSVKAKESVQVPPIELKK